METTNNTAMEGDDITNQYKWNKSPAEIKKIAKDNGYTIKYVTKSLTRYPEPIIGFAVLDFKTFEDCKGFAKKYGGETKVFTWDNGRSLVNIKENAQDMYDIISDISNNIIINSYKDLLRYVNNHFMIKYHNITESVIDDDNEDDIEYLTSELGHYINVREQTLDNFKDFDFDNKFIEVIKFSYSGMVYKEHNRFDISYSYDSHNYEIGVFFTY